MYSRTRTFIVETELLLFFVCEFRRQKLIIIILVGPEICFFSITTCRANSCVLLSNFGKSVCNSFVWNELHSKSSWKYSCFTLKEWYGCRPMQKSRISTKVGSVSWEGTKWLVRRYEVYCRKVRMSKVRSVLTPFTHIYMLHSPVKHSLESSVHLLVPCLEWSCRYGT